MFSAFARQPAAEINLVLSQRREKIKLNNSFAGWNVYKYNILLVVYWT